MNSIFSSLLVFTLTISSIVQPVPAFADPPLESTFYLPVTSQRLSLTQDFQPTLVKGITIYPRNPLLFDFIVDPAQTRGTGALDKEIQRIINYFFASLTIPKNDLWVNLSPYEKNRIIPESLGGTEMGRDLLAQDYLLKQLTASLMDPDTALGKEFWNRVYQKTNERFGTTNIAVNTFNKVWIVPSRAVVYQKWPSAFVVDSHLKVLMEEDYVALTHNARGAKYQSSAVSHLTSDIVKELILPKIEKEVNEGRYFAPLRQIYQAMILAEWYKRTLKQSLLAKVYVNQNKIRGIDLKDRNIKNKIYQRYLHAYRQGLYNFIKEDYDANTQEIVPRKYFAGGISLYAIPTLGIKTDPAQLSQIELNNLSSTTLSITAEAVLQGLTDKKWREMFDDRLYPKDFQPIQLKMNHGPKNLVMFDPYGHAVSFPNGEWMEYNLSIPSGDKSAHLLFSDISSKALIKSTIVGIYHVPSLPADVLGNPSLIRHKDTPELTGAGFTIKIKPNSTKKYTELKLSSIFGSGKSTRDLKRIGFGDPMAYTDTISVVDNGNDIKVKGENGWKFLENTGSDTVLQAVNQPRITTGPHDEHNYVLRLKFQKGVTVTVNKLNDLIITFKNNRDVLIKAELYSDHTPIQHLALEDLYTQNTLEQWFQLQDEDQTWHPKGTDQKIYKKFKKAVTKLRERQLELGPNDKKEPINSIKTRIEQMGKVLGLTTEKINMAINPVHYYTKIPFFRLDRFTTMLHAGQYLISDEFGMAGSPHYPVPFPPDDFMALIELMPLLKPKVVINHFYELLKLERNGQFPHEVDIRHSKNGPYLEDRYRLIRADTELLAMLFFAKVLEKYEIDWNKTIRDKGTVGDRTVGDIVEKVARFVLDRAKVLDKKGGLYDFMTSKRLGDPRGSWRDGASSTFYGKFQGLGFLMVLALKAIEKINKQKEANGQRHTVTTDNNLEALIQTWQTANEQFKFTQTREYRIQALMDWYSWKIDADKKENNDDDKEGLNFTLALFEDAKKYYGIDFKINTQNKEKVLASIKKILEDYMPGGNFSGHAIALDAEGVPIKIYDTDPDMFPLFEAGVPMKNIKDGLKLKFLHMAFGGTSTTSGGILTPMPTVLKKDRYVKNPLGAPDGVTEADGSVDIYKAYQGNYHGAVEWPSMEYKELNGLVRQIDHLFQSGQGNSPDVKNLILAVMLRFDELARKSDLETQETLEPFAFRSIDGGFRLGWRPYSNAKTGIRSGALQLFNLTAFSAIRNLEILKEKLRSQTNGTNIIDEFEHLILTNPAGAREIVTKWLEEPLSGGIRNTGVAGNPAMSVHHSNLGGIDLNTDLYNLTVLNNKNIDLPYSYYDANFSPVNIEGISPRIIHERPFHVTSISR